ncbi:MarR family EPS-associated transcriptional regulator [Roseicyclus amphidinii]|uniref:MarR family EPS-associated transcriptional regulator n=1 Tax=Roseicyclus amphidinii TaxID=3034232 RepID=UPI0024E157DA|nr:MarR family EPS-associated transcriptional regulator [Roseicyclus sp. Amp-Y-6]
MPRRPNEDAHFRMMRLIEARPDISQRELSRELGLSLGAVNYCVNALIEKGHVKMRNFRASENKLGYVYLLTPAGLAQKTRMTRAFLARKMTEYEALKAEIESIEAELGQATGEGK